MGISMLEVRGEEMEDTNQWRYELADGCLRIAVPRELDHHCARQLQQEADQLIDTYHVHKLIFDFKETEFMDSSGIGVLIGRSKNMKFCGGSVAAAHLNARVEKIFRMSGLKQLIRVEE